MVNRPSLSVNNAVVYYKFSDDGVTWDAGSLGTRLELADGRGIGSSPYVKWVNAGGPNGMVIVSAKWGTDSNDYISGGQNFYVNYNLGQGTDRFKMCLILSCVYLSLCVKFIVIQWEIIKNEQTGHTYA